MSHQPPFPSPGVRDPAQGDACCPQAQTCPHPPDRERSDVGHLRQRIETDAENETADPAEDLGVSVSLKPRAIRPRRRVGTGDVDEVQSAPIRARDQHEGETSQDPGLQAPLQGEFRLLDVLTRGSDVCCIVLLPPGAGLPVASGQSRQPCARTRSVNPAIPKGSILDIGSR